MKLSRSLSKWAGIMLMSYGCLAAAKTIVNVNIGTPPPPPPPPIERQYDIVPPPPPSSHYSWKPVQDGRIPRRAVVGGQEGNMVLYVCQAFYRNGVHPGKVVAGRCNIAWGGTEIPLHDFRVLVGEGLSWRSPRHGKIPPNAVRGGFAEGQPLYVCHAQYGFNGVHPGKIWAGSACNIPYGGREIPMHKYEILVSD